MNIAAPTHSGRLVRADDQIRLSFDLYNGTVDPISNRIQALLADEPIFYVVSFGSQHTSEAGVFAADTPADAALPHRRAGPSRVAVEVAAGTPYSVDALLDFAAFALHLDDRANGAPPDPATEPAADVTAIEVPVSLVLSPNDEGRSAARFRASSALVARGDVTELWRAHLERIKGDTAPTMRAIWSRPGNPNTFESSPDEDHRALIVDQTTGPGGVPLTVTQLTLSSLGATFDVAGAWATGLPAAYRHRSIAGRDVHVEVVTRGYLAPFGHPASLTVLSERELRSDASGDATAVLTQDTYLAIGEPTITYPVDFMPHEGRRLPFLSVTATDPGSGPVGRDRIVLPNGSNINRDKAALLSRDGAALAISYTALDRAGNAGVTFALPAVFVADSEAYEPNDEVDGTQSVLAKLVTFYAESASDAQRDLELGGQPVGWADASPRGAAGSVQTTNRIRLLLDRPEGDAEDPAVIEERLREIGRPAFYPGVATAFVVDGTSATNIGGAAPENEVSIAQRWLDFGVGELNVDLGYLDLVTSTVITPTTDALGMLATSLDIGTFGQLSGPGFKFPDGNWDWDPATALAGLPKLLGLLDLADLVGTIDLAGDLFDGEGLPSVSLELQTEEGNPIPTGVCIQFNWQPKLNSFPPDGDGGDSEPKTFVVTADFADEGITRPAEFGDGETHTELALTTCLPSADTTFTAKLERFALLVPQFLPGISVPAVSVLFNEVRFEVVNGASSVDTEIADWSFINALGWLEPIKDFLLELLGLGAATFDGGIFIDFEIPLPDILFGVIGVSDMKVGLGIALPDDGASSIDLAVCTRDDPFTITVMGYGGSGSFGLEVDAAEIVMIEGSMAVTFELAADVFLVSASLSASIGVFVEYENREVTLGAYAELEGSASVLGLVNLTGSVTVALIYNVTTKLLRGVAAVTAEVSSPFGKKDVTHDVEVEVALGDDTPTGRFGVAAAPAATGVSGDLSFHDHYSRTDWNTYCAAFAA